MPPKTSDFQKILETVESLLVEERAMLVEIVQNRLKEQRRQELIEAVKESRREYAEGKVRQGSIADLLAELDS